MSKSSSMAPERRFWAKVVKPPEPAGCWLWDGACEPRGYGQLGMGKGKVYAHRFSYELHFGPIPAGMLVCHRCDTPACVRPDHLFLGSPATNTHDAMTKGRMGRLSRAQVAEIRALAAAGKYRTQLELAARFGISASYICRILRGTARAIELERSA